MPSGGARPGAGRPRKPISEKILEGNPGKREMKVLQFINEDNKSKNQKSKIPEYLDLPSKEGDASLPTAGEIYLLAVEFIKAAGCLGMVSDMLIQDFAYLRRAYLECEWMNKTKGRIANGKRSPYFYMSLDYQKASLSAFNQIWDVISQSSMTVYEKDKNTFLSSLEKRGF